MGGVVQKREIMKPIIIALSGKKGSGKNTISSSICDDFINYRYKGVRNGFEFCKQYAFADLLKEFCINVLGLNYNQCYGSDDEKNSFTKYEWKNTPFSGRGLSNNGLSNSKLMTGREVMQIFGTECVRSWFGNVWASATIRKILQDCPVLAVITDNRFPSEVDAILEYSRGFVIRLTRSPYSRDEHSSETALDEFDWKRDRCYILDNQSLSMEEQKKQICPILDDIFLKMGV